MAPAGFETTADRLLGGRVALYQPRAGFRAAEDSVWLGAAVAPARTDADCLDLGCGAGAALFTAAHRLAGARFTGLDRDPRAVACARAGVAANGWGGRVEIVEGDAGALAAEWENRFDLVFSNPPFFPAGAVTSPGPGKADAYLETLPLSDWVKAMCFAAKPGAWLVLLHRAEALHRVLAAFDRRTGAVEVLPIRPRAGAAASRVLVRGRKGLKPGDLKLHYGLDLDSAAAGALADGAGLDWA